MMIMRKPFGLALMSAVLSPLSLLLFAGVLASTPVRAEDDVDQFLNQAQAAQRNGSLGAALILATKAVTAAPKNPQCYYVRGRLYAEDAEHEKAVADFVQD